jgi:hypothetical protein
MSTKTDLFLATRADALRRGDRGVYKAMTAELNHHGYVESSPIAERRDFPPLDASALSQVNSMLETTEATAMPERVVPPATPKREEPTETPKRGPGRPRSTPSD